MWIVDDDDDDTDVPGLERKTSICYFWKIERRRWTFKIDFKSVSIDKVDEMCLFWYTHKPSERLS